MELKNDEIIAGLTLSPKVDKKAFTDKRANGLQLIVSWKGSAVRRETNSESCNYAWYFRFAVPKTKKRSQIKVGTWPNMCINKAIDEAKRLNELLKNGIDPRTDNLKKRIERIDQAAKESGLVPSKLRFETVLQSMADNWDRTGKERRTLDKYKQALEKHAFPIFFGRNIRTITGKEWDELISRLANIDKLPGAASNTHKAGRRLFSYAVEQEHINYNPLLKRKISLDATQLTPDERFLEAEDIHKFLNELEAQAITEKAKINLMLMMLVGVRVEEWERVKIGWINFSKMRIEHPASAMKNRQKAWTHLPKPAIEILIQWLNKIKEEFGPLKPSWYLFPSDESPAKPERTKLSDHTSEIKEWINFSPKLLRKTISTHLQRQGCPPAVLRAIRNQSVTTGVESHYDFDDLFHLKKQWIEKWAALLEKAKKDASALHTERDSVLDNNLSEEVANLFN